MPKPARTLAAKPRIPEDRAPEQQPDDRVRVQQPARELQRLRLRRVHPPPRVEGHRSSVPASASACSAGLVDNRAMPDFLSFYAQSQPDKLAVVDDRPDGSVTTLTWAELEAQANQLANVLLAHGARPGSKVVWCGQNSIPVVVMVNAARKAGITAVPLNYRLSDEEAAYVVDHCDATIVFVDAEMAPMFGRIKAETSKVSTVLVYGGEVPEGMANAEALMAEASAAEPAAGRARRDDDLHLGHDGQAEGGAAQRRRRPDPGPGHDRPHRLHARRRLHHDRAALPLGSGRVHGHRARPRPDASSSSVSSTRRTGCGSSTATASRRRSRRRRRSGWSARCPRR